MDQREIEENVAYFAHLRGEPTPTFDGCPECHGEGAVVEDCDECDGTKEIIEDGVTTECDECDDNGQIAYTCSACGATGGYRGPARLHPVHAYLVETTGSVCPIEDLS